MSARGRWTVVSTFEGHPPVQGERFWSLTAAKRSVASSTRYSRCMGRRDRFVVRHWRRGRPTFGDLMMGYVS